MDLLGYNRGGHCAGVGDLVFSGGGRGQTDPPFGRGVRGAI